MDPGDRGVLPDPWRDWLRRTCRYGKYLRPGSEDRDVCRLRKRKDGGWICGRSGGSDRRKKRSSRCTQSSAKNSLNRSVLQQAFHYCHIGVGSILLLQFSYCHTYKISPQNYKKESQDRHKCGKVFIPPKFLGEKQSVPHRETTCFTPRNKRLPSALHVKFSLVRL